MQEVERMDGYGEESYPAKVGEARRRGALCGRLSRSSSLAGKARDAVLPEARPVQTFGNEAEVFVAEVFSQNRYSCFVFCSWNYSWNRIP